LSFLTPGIQTPVYAASMLATYINAPFQSSPLSDAHPVG